VRTRLSADCRESDSDRATLPLFEDIRNAEIFKRVCGGVGSVSASTLGVHDTLGNALTIKVGKKVHKVVILEQKRAVLAYSLDFVGMRVWYAI